MNNVFILSFLHTLLGRLFIAGGVFFLRYMSLSGNQLPLHFVLRRASSVIIFSFLKITEPLVTIFCSFFRIRASLSCTFYKLTIPMAVYAKQVMLKKITIPSHV